MPIKSWIYLFLFSIVFCGLFKTFIINDFLVSCAATIAAMLIARIVILFRNM